MYYYNLNEERRGSNIKSQKVLWYWKNDKMEGYGIMLYENGYTFEGYYRNY